MATNSTTRRRAKDPRSGGQKLLLRYGWLIPLVTLAVGVGVLAVTYAFASIPLPSDIELASAAEVYDRNGDLIGIYSGEERRFLIDTKTLPGYVGQAVIAAEDRDFYEHNGISPRGIVRAAWENITGGGISQGGSTITQQYIKNAVLRDPERTITRKIKEAILAVKLERRYTKRQILGFYLNTIYLGRGAYGIEAAARVYFDKPATKLTLGEAAYLAGIISAPESYQPKGNQEGARGQRDRVLEAMVQLGSITQQQADEEMDQKVKAIKDESGETKTQEAAYFMEWLRKDVLEPEYGSDLYTSGFKIYTTLDLGLQAEAEEAVDNQLAAEDKVEAAVVSMTPRGEVRALVGGRDFNNVKRARGFNFVSDNGRQPGSAHKPFTLLTAIEQGISPSSRFSGASPAFIEDPTCANPDGTPWEVDNYGGSSVRDPDPRRGHHELRQCRVRAADRGDRARRCRRPAGGFRVRSTGGRGGDPSALRAGARGQRRELDPAGISTGVCGFHGARGSTGGVASPLHRELGRRLRQSVSADGPEMPGNARSRVVNVSSTRTRPTFSIRS